MKLHVAVVGVGFAAGRLFFAGEHTAEQSATMEGAIASGLRASEQVMEKINEQ
jgi:monoamine oxidase